MNYPFATVHFSGRDVEIAGILDGSASPLTSFEASSFSFIREWCSGRDFFTQHTSGSTGPPKSISISRTAMTGSAKLTQQALNLRAGDTALLCLDPNFIAGKMMIVRAFVTGMKLAAIEPSLNPLEKLNPNLQIDFVALIPSQLTEILNSDSRGRLNGIRKIIIGGAPLNEPTRNIITEIEAQVYATYGMTETVSHIALQALNGNLMSDYFRVLPGVTINIDDRGCLRIKTPFQENEVTTNDLVEIKNANEFKWIGRFDNVINTGGIKVIPEKLEVEIQQILSVMGVSNKSVISSVPDPTFGETIVLLIEGELQLPINRVISSLSEKLPRYHVPKRILTNATIVRTENGKVNRPETKMQIEGR